MKTTIVWLLVLVVTSGCFGMKRDPYALPYQGLIPITQLPAQIGNANLKQLIEFISRYPYQDAYPLIAFELLVHNNQLRMDKKITLIQMLVRRVQQQAGHDELLGCQLRTLLATAQQLENPLVWHELGLRTFMQKTADLRVTADQLVHAALILNTQSEPDQINDIATLVRFLLKSGADVNSSMAGKTVLMRALDQMMAAINNVLAHQPITLKDERLLEAIYALINHLMIAGAQSNAQAHEYLDDYQKRIATQITDPALARWLDLVIKRVQQHK